MEKQEIQNKLPEISVSKGPNIKFIEKTHKYFLDDNGQELISATTFIKQFFAPFDKYRIASELSEKNNQPVDFYLKEWERAGPLGTLVHKYGENKILGSTLPVAPDFEHKMLFKAVDNVFKEQNPKFVFTERIVGSSEIGIAGTIDLGINIKNKLFLGDWKTNKKIDLTGFQGKKAKAPIDYLDDCNYMKYTLQLSLYRFIIEEYYNEPIYGLKLIHLLRDGTYVVYDPEYLRNEIKAMLRYDGRLK